MRELVDLALTILSLFKYLEYRRIREDDAIIDLTDSQQIVGVIYAMTFLFDKPLLQIDKLNKLNLGQEDQSLEHQLYMDVFSFFVSN